MAVSCPTHTETERCLLVSGSLCPSLEHVNKFTRGGEMIERFFFVASESQCHPWARLKCLGLCEIEGTIVVLVWLGQAGTVDATGRGHHTEATIHVMVDSLRRRQSTMHAEGTFRHPL